MLVHSNLTFPALANPHKMRTAALQASRQGAGLLVATPLGRSVHVAARKLIVCEGERQQQGEASTSQPAAPPRSAAPSVRVPGQQLQQRRPPPGPYGENTNVKVRFGRLWGP